MAVNHPAIKTPGVANQQRWASMISGCMQLSEFHSEWTKKK
jgi:hypothetical protein